MNDGIGKQNRLTSNKDNKIAERKRDTNTEINERGAGSPQFMC